MKKLKSLTEEEKKEIFAYAKIHGYIAAQNKYGVWADTIKYNADRKYRDKIKKDTTNFLKNKLLNDPDYAKNKLMRDLAYRKMRKETGVGPKKWREWYEKNKEKSRLNSIKHRVENLEKYKAAARQRYLTTEKIVNREKYKNDIIFKLKANLRESLRRALKYGQIEKESPSIKYLGCSIEEFKQYIEKQFKPGMSWENHGRGENCWHLDHIKPLNTLKEDINTLESLCHYLNYQPLWEKENLSKNSKYES